MKTRESTMKELSRGWPEHYMSAIKHLHKEGKFHYLYLVCLAKEVVLVQNLNNVK